MNTKYIATLAMVASLSMAVELHAQTNFGTLWQQLPVITTEQTRVVYYRPAGGNYQSSNIYVDGEFQTSLLSGGYSVFCLKPGVHSLGSYSNDAPTYQGKKQQVWRDNLAAGKTYYIMASIDGSGRPLVIDNDQAQVQLAGTRQQTHVLSRASSVISCQTGTNQSYDNYEFSSDLLFSFGSANSADISAKGYSAIQQFTASLKRNEKMNQHIIVTGFTDPIGNNESNVKLGQRRADTIKKLLVDNGIANDNIQSQSMGESQVVKHCSGALKQQVACYASERRVIISIENK